MTRAPQSAPPRKRSLTLPPALRVCHFDTAGNHYVVLSFAVSPHEARARLGAESTTSPALARLTPAERAVFAHVLKGRGNARIAALRCTSTRTVANQLAHIYDKLGARGRAMLLARYGGRDPE